MGATTSDAQSVAEVETRKHPVYAIFGEDGIWHTCDGGDVQMALAEGVRYAKRPGLVAVFDATPYDEVKDTLDETIASIRKSVARSDTSEAQANAIYGVLAKVEDARKGMGI